jgi:hypothetical protein
LVSAKAAPPVRLLSADQLFQQDPIADAQSQNHFTG